GDVPPELLNKRLFKIDLESLFRDSKNSAELESKVAGILSDVAKSDSKVILLVDPIQSLLGASAAFDGAISALLRDAIRNGDVQCLGASTEATFEHTVTSDETPAPVLAPVDTKEEADNAGETE